jgi:arylformamidase
MTYYDVSMAIHKDMQVYKNKPEKKPMFSYAITHQPHFVSETSITLNLHSGTHVDFPRHMIENGMLSTAFDPMTFYRDVKVFDLTHISDFITKEELIKLDIKASDMVFFKTKNSLVETFDFEFIYLSSDGAAYLADIGIFALGIDGLGIERNDPMHQTHHILMNQNIWIIEGLRLKEVKQKMYHCIALPTFILDSDALPLRVILHD